MQDEEPGSWQNEGENEERSNVHIWDYIPREGENKSMRDGPGTPDGPIDLERTHPGPWSFKDDFESVSKAPKGGMKGKGTKKASSANSIENDLLKDLKQVICFEVPSKDGSGVIMTSKAWIPIFKTFLEVHTLIHCEIRCDGVKEKHFPSILLHLSKDLKKILHPFKTEGYWEDVKMEWELEVKSKKQAAHIEVHIPEKWLKELAVVNKLHAAHLKAATSKNAASGKG
ncbi:hypothetical protein M422DRAFT_54691 [Sphaerobolus stellatus SS14]|uniref:Uncharacterized protein n=1 Tax=Sphaerobolus stellatus (strain SS14) TaxID=990650 RepID=A0A0C9TFT5_SPHS4|nr:hypothetical protein M422DRAFT_54691 [Sphaerobolus stellatus SS14]